MLICRIYRPNSYRAENTLRLGYKNQLVNAVYRNNRSFVWYPMWVEARISEL